MLKMSSLFRVIQISSLCWTTDYCYLMQQIEPHSCVAYCTCIVQYAGPYYTPRFVRFILRDEGGHIDFTID